MTSFVRTAIKHFLSVEEVIQYRHDGTWSHDNDQITTYPAYIAAWFKRRFGQESDVLTAFHSMENTLITLGPGSSVKFIPRGDAVGMEIRDSKDALRYKGHVYYDHEDMDWFQVSIRMACACALDTCPREAFR